MAVNMSYFLVVNIIKILIVEIILIVLEIFKPKLVVRDNLPIGVPSFKMCPSVIIPIKQRKIKFIIILIVFGNDMCLSHIDRPIKLPCQGVFIMIFLINSISKIVNPIFINLLNNLLKFEQR